METYNFQVNKVSDKKEWGNIEPLIRSLPDGFAAVQYAQRLTRIFKAEVRLTQGLDPGRANGAYFHYQQD